MTDKDIRAKAFEAAMEINQEGHGDLDYVLADAIRIEEYLRGSGVTANVYAVRGEEASVEMRHVVLPADGPGLQLTGALTLTPAPQAASNVVDFPPAATVSETAASAATVDPEPAPTERKPRKARGPNKTKAKKAATRKSKANGHSEPEPERIDDEIPHLGEPAAEASAPTPEPAQTEAPRDMAA